jgi:DNA uptake protein ComE-like DNA-binding protein
MKLLLKTTILLLAFSSLSQAEDVQPVEQLSHVVEFANTATSKQIQEVKGYGKVMAGRVIAARPFKHSKDVRAIKGIGKVKFAALVAYCDESAE